MSELSPVKGRPNISTPDTFFQRYLLDVNFTSEGKFQNRLLTPPPILSGFYLFFEKSVMERLFGQQAASDYFSDRYSIYYYQ